MQRALASLATAQRLSTLGRVALVSPAGSTDIAQWAAQSGLGYEAFPEERWFRRWEPHDAIAPPTCFFNSCTWVTSPGHVVLVEPWYAPEDGEPLERTVMAFAHHPLLQRRAAIRAGDPGERAPRRAVAPALKGFRPSTDGLGDKIGRAHV